jgi:polysaccharide export outer membrane protein
LALKSRDRVSVRAIPNWQPDETVVLEGEFRFPGEYALLPGETLGQLIDRVGGVTVQAFPYGAVYTAQVAAETERAETERFADEIRRSYAGMALTQQQQRATFQELELSIQAILDREALGRIAIDFPRILAGDRGADVVLSDGDKVFMPRRNDTVTVLGEVFRPGSFRFEQGLTLDDYLALGAGATARADQRGLYIVRANGRVERPEASFLRFALSDAAVQPGDTIVVPVNASYRDPLDFWTSITQVAYQTGIAIAAVLRN